MIQELLGGGATGVLGGERKISINSGVFQSSPSISPSPSPSPSSSAATTPTSSSAADSQNLRCPRCDSANTKFCYYNNYNLTQPRHFCKTCRRYWTKGGALRNVPIGGGCRKNKSTIAVAASVGKASPGKLKTVSSELGKSGFINGFGLDHDPIIWASPQSSHLLALLRSTQNPNPSANPNSVNVKEEGFMFGSHMPAATGAFNTRALGLDSLGQVPFWRSNQFQAQQQLEQRNGGFSLGEVIQNSEFYNQRLGSSANFSPVILGNVACNSTSSTCSTILESAPIAAGGDLGNFWNPSLSWSDLPTANGTAYP
ncbi:hypothetical protein RJ639_018105 [Escallonia herrerae]|uniref:Dof zinc finger protein n=1 Tax=Escallonia herrerae TaxID=1293975 RepID=A0AA89AJS1_9ASTE|nr:hypothetical protein RJ639_018105 [Escallonia herrerae]